MKTVMIAAMLMGLIGAGTCGGGGEEAAEAEAQAPATEASAEQAAAKDEVGLEGDSQFDPVSVKKINNNLRNLKTGVQQKADDRAEKLDNAAGQ